MSSAQIDKILSVYKRLYQIPSLTSNKIIPKETNGIIVQSLWSQRNLERRTKQKFFQEYNLDQDLNSISVGFPVDITSELLSASSENDKLKAILREVTVDGKSKQFIEIWDMQHMIKSYDLSAYDVHGDVYTDATFSSFCWSTDNKKLLFVAEKKLTKSEPFYKQKSKSKSKTDDKEEPISRGTEYVFKPEWGEQLVGKHRSVIVILNLDDDTIVSIDSIPDDYFPAQVIWAPNGQDIIGVAYKLHPRYLGLIHCSKRDSYIFHLKGTEFHKLTADGLFCTSPRVSPDKKSLVWLEREISPPHHHVHRLMHLNWDSKESPDILIDLVKKYKVINDNKKFYGLYCQNLPTRCWSEDSKHIFLSTPQRSNIKSYILDLETKQITEIKVDDGSSVVVSDAKANYIAFVKCSIIKPTQLVTAKFNPIASNIGNLRLIECSRPLEIFNDKNIVYEHSEFVYDSYEPVKDFNFTYFGKKDEPIQSVPLIAAIHGGPHSSYCNMFFADYALFVLLGFGVLQINYRGSTGMGGDNVEYLLGKVGNVDVLDCVTAIDSALKKYSWLDPNRVNAYGGSHGGFLSAHLSGQYPDKFKAVVLLNPVIDLPSMFSMTDIPDWCCAETGYPYLQKLTGSELEKMLSHSPIVHVDKVKAPTLIALGSKDLRVPSYQGKLWYYRLKNNNVVTKLFMYEDNHSIRKDEYEIDHIINSVIWLMQYNSNS